MHLNMVEVGDSFADLWGELCVHERRVEGAEDVTMGEHPVLGLCVIRQHGAYGVAEVFSQRPIELAVDCRSRVSITAREIAGRPLHLTTCGADCRHADLWAGLKIEARHIEGLEDVAVGVHTEFGDCVVSHFGFGAIVEWWTQLPIAAEQ